MVMAKVDLWHKRGRPMRVQKCYKCGDRFKTKALGRKYRYCEGCKKK